MVVAKAAFLLAGLSAATGTGTQMAMTANPIRKVVTLLQKMQAQVTAEGEKEKELFEKFMCYCKTGAGDLTKSIEAAEAKVPQLNAEIESSEDEKKQVDETAEQAKVDRKDAKEAMAAATAQREKEAEEFAKFQADSIANIKAVMQAVAALEKGASGNFLQTDSASVLRRLFGKLDLPDYDRQEVTSFLSGNPFSQGYAQQSGEIIGILKTQGDEMSKALADATAVETKSIHVYQELIAAKTKEVGALSRMIEDKIQKSGELAVSIAQMKNDSEDMAETLKQDKLFLAELEKSCDTKQAEWDERCKLRQQELAALAETIKILNNDDSLELFKKTLPAPGSASFIQMAVSREALREQAKELLKREAGHLGRHNGARLNFIALALSGKKIGFEKVVSQIDEMVQTLKQEQQDDDSKKEYCNKELDTADDKKKVLEKSISDTEAAIEACKEGIATLTEEIAALIKGIKDLDASVAAATEQRKEENAEFKELISSDTAAKEILKIAKNRLNKFYNPKMYIAPKKAERSEMDAIAEDVGGVFVQVKAHEQEEDDEAPPPPPETFGAYTKRSEENTGVIQMINILITDLEKEMTAAKVEEKNAQSDYEELMRDSAEKRTKDSKSLAGKETAKAELEGDLQSHQEDLRDDKKDLAATVKYIHGLHLECDWLLKFFDVRKQMRAGEVDALEKAKAVLAGADYSLLETSVRRSLRRR
jgi:septal ring factor EnvC (AmiA/AmiB activator)